MARRDPMNGTARFTFRRVQPGLGDTCIYALGGHFTTSTAAYELLEQVREDIQDEGGAVVLDLTQVPGLTSTGVGIIAALYTASLERGRRFALAGMNRRLTAVMSVSGLLPRISSFETLAAAVQAVGESDALR